MTLDELLALLPDNDTGDIDAADLRTIVTEMWNRDIDFEARIAALESSAVGGVSISGRWQYNSQVGATPQGMQVTGDAADLLAVTWLRFDKFEQTNVNMTNVLMSASALYGQQQDDPTAWVRYSVFDTPTDGGSYVEIPVQYVVGGDLAAEWTNTVFVFEVAL